MRGNRLWTTIVGLVGVACLVGACSTPTGTRGRPAAPGPTVAILPAPSTNDPMFSAVNTMVTNAVLSGDQLPTWANRKYLDNSGYGISLNVTCNAPALAAEGSVIAYQYQTWVPQSAITTPILQQYVGGYGKPIGTDAVGQAKAARTCHSYQWQGTTYTDDGTVDLGTMSSGVSGFGFCERAHPGQRGGHDFSVCTVTLGKGYVACSVRVLDETRASAESRLLSELPAVQKSCSGS